MKKRSNLFKKVKSIRLRKEYKMPLIAAGMVATAALIAFVTTSATYSGASSGSIGGGAVGSIGLVSGGGGATRYPLVHGATIGVSVRSKSLGDIMPWARHKTQDKKWEYQKLNRYFGVDDKNKQRFVKSWHRTDGDRNPGGKDYGEGSYAFTATAMDEIARIYYAENLQPWNDSTTVYTYINQSYGKTKPNGRNGIHFMDGSKKGSMKGGPIINTSDFDDDFSQNHLISLDKGFATKGKKDAVVKATRDSLKSENGYYYKAIKKLMGQVAKKHNKKRISDLDEECIGDLTKYLAPEKIEKTAGNIKGNRAKAQKLFLTAAGTYKKGNSFVVLGQGVLDGYLLQTTENAEKAANETGAKDSIAKIDLSKIKDKNTKKVITLLNEAIDNNNLSLKRINKAIGDQDSFRSEDLAEFNARYAMHYLDLLMCGYEQCNNSLAMGNGIKGSQKEWKNAITKYLTVIAKGSNYDQEVPYIFLTAGTVGVNNRVIEVTDGYTLATARMGLNAYDGSAYENRNKNQTTTLRSGFIGFPVEKRDKPSYVYQTKKSGNILLGTANKNVPKQKKLTHKWKEADSKGSKKVQVPSADVSSIKNSPFLLNNTYEKIIETSKEVNGSSKPSASNSNSWHTTALLATVMDHTKVSQHVGSAGAQQSEQLMKLLHFTNKAGNKTSQIYGTNVIFPPRVAKTSTQSAAFEMHIFSEKVKGSKSPKEENRKTKYVGVNADSNNVNMPILRDTNADLLPPGSTDIKYKEIDFTRSVKAGEAIAKKWEVNDKVHVKISLPKDNASVNKLWKNIETYPDQYKVFVVFKSQKNDAYSGTYKTTMTSSKKDKSTFNGNPTKVGALKNVAKVCEINTKAKGFFNEDTGERNLVTDFSINAFDKTETYLTPGQSLYENFHAKIVIFKKNGKTWQTITAKNKGDNQSFAKDKLSAVTEAGLAKAFAQTNDVTAVYHYKKGNIPTPNPEDGFEFVKTGEISNYASAASHGYTELKEGSIYNETFEAMAGVPTTRTLYYTTGGEEFIVNLQAVYDDYKAKKPSDYKTVRKYKVIYAATDWDVSDYNKAVADALRYDTVRFTALHVWKLDVCWGLLAEFLCL